MSFILKALVVAYFYYILIVVAINMGFLLFSISVESFVIGRAALAITVLIGIIYLVIKKNKAYAACNVLQAKYTFQLLSAEKQDIVRLKAKDLLIKGGITLLGNIEVDNYFASDIEKYGIYACAMIVSDIQPALNKWGWYYVKNPFTVLNGEEKFLRRFSEYYEKRFGVKITI